MVKIDEWLIENLSEDEKEALLVAIKKTEEADNLWLDIVDKLLPLRAQLRSLVKFMNLMTGYNGDNLIDKLRRMFKYLFNINNIRNEVKKANNTYKRIREEIEPLYEKEKIAVESLEKWEYIVGSIIYHKDQMMADGFALRCKSERKKFVESTIEKMVKEYDKALPYNK